MKKNSLSLLFIFLSLATIGQEKKNKNRHHAIAIGAGSGLTADYSFRFNDYFALTARYNLFEYSYNEYEHEIDGETILIDSSIDFKGIDVFLSIHPFKTAFRLIGGYGTYEATNVNITGSFTESVFIGDVEFNANDVGQLLIDLTWKKNLPYAGIGFGRAVPKKRVGFGLEIGTYFAGAPEFSNRTTLKLMTGKDMGMQVDA